MATFFPFPFRFPFQEGKAATTPPLKVHQIKNNFTSKTVSHKKQYHIKKHHIYANNITSKTISKSEVWQPSFQFFAFLQAEAL